MTKIFAVALLLMSFASVAFADGSDPQPPATTTFADGGGLPPKGTTTKLAVVPFADWGVATN